LRQQLLSSKLAPGGAQAQKSIMVKYNGLVKTVSNRFFKEYSPKPRPEFYTGRRRAAKREFLLIFNKNPPKSKMLVCKTRKNLIYAASVRRARRVALPDAVLPKNSLNKEKE
jgi:hypothetical protein